MTSSARRGWKALLVLLALIAVLSGIATWAFITYLAPIVLDADGIGAGTLDTLWLAIGATVAAVLLGFAVDWSSSWTDRLPLLSDAGTAASLSGSTVGAVAGTMTYASTGPREPLTILVPTFVALIIAVFAWRRTHRAIHQTRSHIANIERLHTLHETGTQVRGDVVDVHFHHTWLGDSPLFTVTVAYDTPSGRHRGEGRVVTTIPGAPVIGGTVLVWFSGDGSDVHNIDIVQDHESILDPEASKTYRAPDVS